MEQDPAARARAALRSHWWHPDHLALMGRRLRLQDCRRILDLGCGAGQWASALAEVLPDASELLLLDPSPGALAASAPARAAIAATGRSASALRARAEAIPLADASVDLVTAQTVLMHLADPAAALREVRRVGRAGSRVLLAEPMNRLYAVSTWLADRDRPVDEALDRLATQLEIERRVRDRGHGDHAMPERLCADLEAAGFTGIRVHQSDRVIRLGGREPDEGADALIASFRQLSRNDALLAAFAPLLQACEPSLRQRIEVGLRAEQRRYAELLTRIESGEPAGIFPMHLFLVSATNPGP